MEIYQLKYVLAVNKYRHFSRAAEEICLSQSTLSQQIKKLEEELGVLLFIRSTRSVELTPAGEEFILYAKRIINEMEKVKQAMADYKSLDRGRIVIGAIPTIGYLGLTSLIADFQRNYPGIEIEILESGSDTLLELLLEDKINVALLTFPYMPELENKIDFLPLLNDELVLITADTHPLASREKMDLIEVANENFLFIKSSTGMRKMFAEACLETGFSPKIMYESSQVETICGLVEEGLGVGLLTTRVLNYIKRPGLSVLHLNKKLTRMTSLATTYESLNYPIVKAFKDYSSDWIKKKRN